MRVLTIVSCGTLLILSGCVYGPPPGYVPAPPPYAGGPQANGVPGPECRDVSQTVTIEGREQQASSLSCLQPDGSWAPPTAEQQQALREVQQGGEQGAPAAYAYPYYYGYGYGYDPGWYSYDPVFIDGGFGFGFGGFHRHGFGRGHFGGHWGGGHGGGGHGGFHH